MKNQGMIQYARKPEFENGTKTSGEIEQRRAQQPPINKVTKPRDYRPAFYSDHRRAWQEHFKIKIPEGYHVHHKDKDHTNNNPVNLLCLPIEEHIRIHEMNGDEAAVKILRMM